MSIAWKNRITNTGLTIKDNELATPAYADKLLHIRLYPANRLIFVQRALLFIQIVWLSLL